MKNLKRGLKLAVVVLWVAGCFSPLASAEENLSYDRNFDIQIPQKPAPPLPAVDLSEEKMLFDRLIQELRTPIHPSLGPEIKPDASE